MPSLVFRDAEKARNTICAEQQKEISQLYKDWADEVGKRAKYYESKTTASSYWQQQQMLELQRQLTEQSKVVANHVYNHTKESMYTVSDVVVGCNAKYLQDLGFSAKGVAAAFTSVPTQVVNNLVTGQIYESGWSLSKAIWGDNQKTLHDIYQIVAQGRAMNLSAYDIAKQLEKYVNPDRAKQWNLKMEDGRKIYKRTVDYNAQRLVRTLTQHAYQQSVVAVTKSNPFIPVIIWHANGSRACALCEERDGMEYKPEELPMDHPNGMCTMEPKIDMDQTINQLVDWYNADDGKYPEIDKFAIQLGYVPTAKAEKTGYKDKEWLAKNAVPPRMTQGFNYNEDDRNAIIDRLAGAGVSDNYRYAFSKANKDIATYGNDGSYYRHAQLRVCVSANSKEMSKLKSENPYTTVFHEMGHAIDRLAGSKYSNRTEFVQAMISDMDRLAERLKKGEITRRDFDGLASRKNTNGIQDVLGAMSYIKPGDPDYNASYAAIGGARYSWAHSSSYWQRNDARLEAASELFAHISAAQVSPETMKEMKEYFPKTTAEFDNIMAQIAKSKKR